MATPYPYLHRDLRCDRWPSHLRLASLPEMMLLMGGLHRHHNNICLAYEMMFSVLYVVEYISIVSLWRLEGRSRIKVER